MRAARQRGATGLLLLVILALVITALLAAYAVNRLTSGKDDRAETERRLAVAADALERFAAVNLRLPCPSDPAAASGAAGDGVEAQASIATCSFDTGTIPWQTIGMKSDDAVDAWGRKLSYRVYDGNKGSLTQPSGVSMVECDTVETATAGNATSLAGSQGGLCVSSTDPYQRSTTPANFLNAKGLTLTDMGVVHNDTAYVVISHGATGYGGYSLAGTQLPMPAGTERNNTKDTGPFVIQAFSDPDTGVTSGTHFDDLLVYRTIPDLVQRIGLSARDWPETASTSTTFNTATLTAALGSAPPTGDLGTSTINFPGVVVTGFSGGGGAATNVTFDTGSVNTTTSGLGISGNASNFMGSAGNEFIKLQFSSPARAFGVTLNDFGTYASGGVTYTEQAQFTFSLAGTTVGSPVVKSGCRSDGDLASFSITPTSTFDAVEIRPLDAVGSPSGTNTSAFLVSAVQSCDVTVSSCTTSLANGGNTCP